MYLRKYPFRFAFVFIALFAGFFYSILFLLYIQIFRSDYLAKLAQRQHEHSITIDPRRGTIYDRNMRSLASNVTVYSAFANARSINKHHDTNLVIDKVAPILGVEKKFIRDRLAKNKYFVWLGRKLPQEKYEAIKALKIPGIGFVKETKRSYPNKELAAHVIGFAGIDNNGLDGLERDLDKYLKGKPGQSIILRDAHQRELLLERNYIPPTDGFDVILTLDETIQFIAERALDRMYKKYNAKGATIIVMDPNTGEILAFANRPTYNLEKPGDSPAAYRTNRAMVFTYEPGSVFKIVTAAAGLQEKVVQETDIIFCENGAYRVANHILHDHEPEGHLTFRQVIEKSSNIGTVKIAQRLGPQRVYNYAHKFRFGIRTGIDLAGEVRGNLKAVKNWSKVSISAIPIGQEVTVTPMQLLGAISAIANNGVYMKPYVIKKIVDSNGEVILEKKPEEVEKIMSNELAVQLRSMLQGVVDKGTAKKAQIKGVTVGGKTGTAQKVVNGRYSHSHFDATFIGFAPVDKPRLAAVVVYDEPHPVYYGGLVAAPVFAEVIENSLKYLDSQQSIAQVDSFDEDRQ